METLGRTLRNYYQPGLGASRSSSTSWIGILLLGLGSIFCWGAVAADASAAAHSVGGTVSGLRGSGLVLRLAPADLASPAVIGAPDLGEALAISSNGAFVFPTPFPSQLRYRVSVQTQPSNPGQTCTLANGLGLMGEVDVTDVQVNCETQRFTVGGRVEGLLGAGLVLGIDPPSLLVPAEPSSGSARLVPQPDLAETLAIGSNGAFTFPVPRASGSRYSISVATQPSAPDQVCWVAYDSGTVIDRAVSDVQVTCTARAYVGPVGDAAAPGQASVVGGGDGCGFIGPKFVSLAGLPSPPAGYSFPYGLFDFRLEHCTPGSQVRVSIEYPGTLPGGTQYWKYGPTPDKPNEHHWYQIAAHIAGNSVTFHITDGGLGDDDLTVNGTIVDQGGPGLREAAAVPALSGWALLALPFLLLAFVARRPGLS